MKKIFKTTLSLLLVYALAFFCLSNVVFASPSQGDPLANTNQDAVLNETDKTTESSAALNGEILLPELESGVTVASTEPIQTDASSEATALTSGDFTYLEIDGGVAVTKYNGSAKEVTVPDTIDGKPVIEVRNGFITNVTTSLILGNNVKAFKATSFAYTWLEKIVIPAATTEIDAGSLYSLNTLKVFGKKGSYIETYVASNLSNAMFISMDLHEDDFYYDSIEGGVAITYYEGSEKNLTLPSSLGGQPVVSIESKAFADNNVLTTVTIQNGLKSIKNDAFSRCFYLSSITIPESVTEMGSYPFPLWSSKIKIIGIKGSYAETFAQSHSLSFLDINNSENGYYFEDTQGGVKLVAYGGADRVVLIPSSFKGKPVVAIGLNAFSSVPTITEVVIPDSVTNLEEDNVPYGNGIFAYHESLIKLTFGKGITKIPANLAATCMNLEEVIFNGDVTSIGNQAFWQCSKLQKMALPQSLTSIGDSAFSYSKSLTSLSIPDKTTTIGSGAFTYCDRLENLNLGKSLTKLSDRAFASCNSLKEVTLPTSLTTIDSSDVFAKCTALSKVTIPNTTTSITQNIFRDNPNTTIYGTKGSYAQSFASQYGIPFVATSSAFEVNTLYRTHVQNVGWQDYKSNGEMSGTSARALRLEGIEIKLEQQKYDLSVNYATHVENIGWQDWKTNGQMSGTSALGLRLEAIRIKLSGNDAQKFDIYYRVHAQNVGWMGWAKNGADAGTAGYGYRLEGIEIQVLPKDSPAPGSVENPFLQKN